MLYSRRIPQHDGPGFESGTNFATGMCSNKKYENVHLGKTSGVNKGGKTTRFLVVSDTPKTMDSVSEIKHQRLCGFSLQHMQQYVLYTVQYIIMWKILIICFPFVQS